MSKDVLKTIGTILLTIILLGFLFLMLTAPRWVSSIMQDTAIKAFGSKTSVIAWQDEKYDLEKRYLSHEVTDNKCMEGSFGPGWIQVIISFEWRRKEFTGDIWTEWNRGYALYLVEIHEYQAPIVVKKVEVFDNVKPPSIPKFPLGQYECFPP
jgi:hypothetical protein